MLSADDFRRLQWHSRRGMLELDVLLEPFTNQVFKKLSVEDQSVYLKLIDCEDPDLFAWFMGDGRPQDPGLASMVDKVLQYARSGLASGLKDAVSIQ
ncbi:succinate dehydrogenase assembly factor 2 [Endozoicomonas sp. 8E]|uniref:FAD assembly factor SdhE n=1 Tax=Endozoicomonas sp. 8E TaxID=3035692 RepID=UPI00293915B5|nr:succinate dehydrogenase assembly factor 2 [Endozoicomonas sp. 8E]WOG25579.1 succinate dehydrogenase assembly factor 2 [Endozoicomonas sp. 8E]